MKSRNARYRQRRPTEKGNFRVSESSYAYADKPNMDSKNTNIFCRRAMGFFLTQRKRTDSNTFEHDLYEGAFKIAADALRDSKIRGATIHENFGGL